MIWIAVGFCLVFVLEAIHRTLTEYDFSSNEKSKKSRRRR